LHVFFNIVWSSRLVQDRKPQQDFFYYGFFFGFFFFLNIVSPSIPPCSEKIKYFASNRNGQIPRANNLWGEEMTGVRTKIQNIVLSVTYEGTEFNLEKLDRSLDGARYDPESFPGVVYKSEDPRASFLIFSSGKMNCVGASSMADAKLAIKKLTEKLRKARIKVKSEPKVKVQNIVASINFGRKFDLERIASRFENVEYEPEVFPGLVFRLDDPKVVILLFVSGKGVCAGAKSMRDVTRAAQNINKILSRR